MGVFDFSLILDSGPNDAHFKVIKVLNPTVNVWVLPGCPVCAAVREFFEDQEGVTVKLYRGNERTAEPPRARSKALSADFPVVEYVWNRETYNVPLPKLHDGAMPSTIKTRLRNQFINRVKALREHQKDLHRAFESRDMNARNTPAFTLMWEMGSGKTLGATSLMVNHRSHYNMVVCNNSNIGYWVDHIMQTPFITEEEVEKAMRKPGGGMGASRKRKADLITTEDDDADKDEQFSEMDRGVETKTVVSRFHHAEKDVVLWFEVVGYSAFKTEFDNPRALKHYNCLVLDEAHYFRNNTTGMQMAMAAAHSAKNMVLLTGTPLVNDAEDIIGMMALTDMDGEYDWEGDYRETGELPEPKEVGEFLKGHVSWFAPETHRPNMFKRHYPTLETRTIRVPMGWYQTLEYLMAQRAQFDIGEYRISQGKSNRYNCLTRAVCNAPSSGMEDSPKLNAVRDQLDAMASKGRQVVHSSLVETGIIPLRKMLGTDPRFAKTRTDIITGSTPNDERDRIRTRYNKGKIDVLFISDASQFGLDLQATKAIHLIEPHPNLSTENQTTARAVRMGSHKNVKDKVVERFKYISVFPEGKITKAQEAEVLRRCIADKTLGSQTKAMLEDIQIGKELEAKINETKTTINEEQEVRNRENHVQIVPYLEAYRKASVEMSTQKGVCLYGTGKPAEKKAARKKGMKSAGCQTVLRASDFAKDAPVKLTGKGAKLKPGEAQTVLTGKDLDAKAASAERRLVTKEEREKIKAMGPEAQKAYMKARFAGVEAIAKAAKLKAKQPRRKSPTAKKPKVKKAKVPKVKKPKVAKVGKKTPKTAGKAKK